MNTKENSLCLINKNPLLNSIYIKNLYDQSLYYLHDRMFIYQEIQMIYPTKNAVSVSKNEMKYILETFKNTDEVIFLIIDSAKDFEEDLIIDALKNENIFTIVSFKEEDELNKNIIENCSCIEKLYHQD